MFGLEMEFFRSAVRTTSRELSAQKSGGQSHSVFQHAQTKQTPERICRKKTLHSAGAAWQSRDSISCTNGGRWKRSKSVAGITVRPGSNSQLIPAGPKFETESVK